MSQQSGAGRHHRARRLLPWTAESRGGEGGGGSTTGRSGVMLGGEAMIVGIETPDDAWARLRAGATLVQAYTGFIYGGPLWPRRMHAGLARRARAAGLASIGAAQAEKVS